MKIHGIFIGILLVLLTLTGIAFADQPVNATPEIQNLVTGTSADVVGMATETDSGVWTLTYDPVGVGSVIYVGKPIITGYSGDEGAALNGILYWNNAVHSFGGSILTAGPYWVAPNYETYILEIMIPASNLNAFLSSVYGSGPVTWGDVVASATATSTPSSSGGIHTGVLDPGQIQYTTAYDANIVAQSGHTVLVKGMNIHTGNKVAATQSNLNANTLLTYVATGDGGNVVGSENLLIDGAGNSTKASDRMLCPFASVPIDEIPAYCNIVQAGSSFDLTVGTVKTAANDRFVGTDATIPVALNYNIAVSPYGTTDGSIPAIGSASAYIKAHIQEARTNASKAEDLQYSETSTASGYIQQFVKDMHYQSGKSLMP